jgi:hypothetical protein
LSPYVWPTLQMMLTKEDREKWGIRADASMQVNIARAVDGLLNDRDDYKTLARVGRWHNECRPNRNQAAQTIRDMQATIDRMADAVSEANRARERTEAELRIAVECDPQPHHGVVCSLGSHGCSRQHAAEEP